MTANPHLAAQLDDFAALEKPGFAIMITAPWGAGKTHAVKSWLGTRDHLYVSLFGIDSLAGVEEALFEAALEAMQKAGQGKSLAKSIDGAARIVQGAIKAKTGATFDATGLVRKAVLAGSPRLLVIDDLERAQLDPPRLLSIVNRFVEHEGKNVLLLANEDELERAKGQPDSGEAKSDYRRWREKVVGRTITLHPDTDAALDTFLAAIVDGGARTTLAQRRDVILDVFSRSQTDNLRLLRQSLIECGRFLTRLPESYRRQDGALACLIADYLALSIDWHAGERLTRDDFDTYGLAARQFERRNDANAPISGLDRLRDRHEESPFSDLHGRYMPFELAFKFIVEGYASEGEVGQFMREAEGFLHEFQDDALATLERWYEREEQSVEAAYRTIRNRISDATIVEPFEVLRAWDSILFLSRNGLFDLDSNIVVNEACLYIAALGNARLVAGSSAEDVLDNLSMGGDGRDPGWQTIRNELRNALLRSRNEDAPRQLRGLLNDLQSDPLRFSQAIGGGDRSKGIPDLREWQVFQSMDAKAVAEEVFGLPADRWRRFLSPMKRRQSHLDFLAGLEDGLPNNERAWLLAFRARALQLAAVSTPVRRAQILWAINKNLAFLDATSDPQDS